MKFNIRLIVCFLLSLLLPNLGFAFTADNQQLHKKINSIMATHNVAAASVILVSKDQVHSNMHLGLKDRVTLETFKQGDMFRIGSISKSFAGVLAVKLAQLGFINLNEPISEYGLARYIDNQFPDHPIKLAQLLEHTAGMRDLSKKEWDYNDSKPISLKESFDLELGAHKTIWKPNGAQSYSNVGPGLFGLALENKLGKSYEELIHEHVLKPLNMKQTDLLLTDGVKDKLITGYNRDGKSKIPYWHNIYRPFAAINTNNKDMIKWLQMWLDINSSFLSKQQKYRITTPKTTFAAKSDLEYGYGLGMYQWQYNGHSFYGHGGDADGYLTRFGVNQDSGLAYFVMINAFNHKPLNQIVNLIEDQIIQGLPKPKYPTRLKLSDDILNKYAGTYQEISSRFGAISNKPSLIVSVENGQLTYQYKNNRAVSIHAVTHNHFRTTNQSRATMAFFESNSAIYFQGDIGDFIKLKGRK